MKSILLWYLALQLFSFTALPLISRICTRLHDCGYGISKGLGLLLVSYFTWVLLFLPHVANWAPFGFATVAIGWVLLALISTMSLFAGRKALAELFKRRLRIVLTCEVIFLIAFALMLIFRGFVPHISYHIADPPANSFQDLAAEKFTDFAILNGLLTSSSFPPHDAWLAPVPTTTPNNGWLTGGWLNYYYFGHFMWAVLIKATGVLPEVGFNLALAGAFALVVLQAFSLGYNVTRRIRWGLLCMFLIALSSNVDGFFQIFSILKTRLVDAQEGAWFLTGPWYRSYDFWRSSRAVQNTITEFPAFSFVLADLHAHVASLVILLAGFNLVVQVWRSARQYSSVFEYQLHNLDELFLLSLVAGALSAANTWDMATFAALLTVAVWAALQTRSARFSYEEPWRVPLRNTVTAVGAVFVTLVTIAFGYVVLFHQFHFYFQSPVDGIKAVQAVNRTDPFEFLAHWILLLAAPTYFALRVLVRRTRTANQSLAVQRFWGQLAVAAAIACVLRPLTGGWTPIVLLLIALLLLNALVGRRLNPTTRLVLGLLLVFFTLAAFCELYYFDDIFNGPIERINTVFKIYYGLWPIMALATVLALRRLIRYAPSGQRFWRGALCAGALVLCGGVYPVLAPIQRISQATRLGHWTPPEGISAEEAPTEMLRPAARARSVEEALNGMRYLKYAHPDDLELVEWIRTNLPGNARLLEAAGTQYTYSGRVSTLTGRPAFAGWLYHAWGWRGERFDKERGRRLIVAQEIYETTSTRQGYDLLRENGIQYVVCGEQEREQYVDINENKFAELGTRVFRSNDTAIYKIDYSTVPPEDPEPEPHNEPAPAADDTVSTDTIVDDEESSRAPPIRDDETTTETGGEITLSVPAE